VAGRHKRLTLSEWNARFLIERRPLHCEETQRGDEAIHKDRVDVASGIAVRAELAAEPEGQGIMVIEAPRGRV